MRVDGKRGAGNDSEAVQGVAARIHFTRASIGVVEQMRAGGVTLVAVLRDRGLRSPRIRSAARVEAIGGGIAR